MIRRIIRAARIYLARRKLERLIRQRQAMPEVIAIRKHRDAAKLGWTRKRRRVA